MIRAFPLRALAFRSLPVVLVLVLATGHAWSDEPGSPSGFRFRGAPGSVTRYFMITEFGVEGLLNADIQDPSLHATWDLGVMRNLGARTALGCTVFLSFNDDLDDVFQFGLKPRFRYWPVGKLHLDASVGLLVGAFGAEALTIGHPTLFGHAGVGLADWISLVVQYEEVKYTWTTYPISPEVHGKFWYVGLTTGSVTGAILGPLVLAGVLLFHDFQL